MKPYRFISSWFSPVYAALLAATLLFIPGQPSMASPVTSKQASAVVTGWLSLDQKPLGEAVGGSVLRVDTFTDKTGNPLYYAVYLDPTGFVIVAGDDLVEPIIAIARAGNYDPSLSNPLGALVSNDMAARVAYVRQTKGAALDKSALQAQAKWGQLGGLGSGPVAKGLGSVSDVRVAPFIQTTWDQGTAGNVGTTACYNYYTPPYGDGNVNNYWAGCVATAMAQLMRYYQYPTTGVGYTAFTRYWDNNPDTYYLHGGNGAGGPYVWSNMPLVPTSTPTPTQCQAIGALVADAGATVNMSYTSTGSSSSLYDGKNALLGTFQFASARYGYNNNNSIGAGLVGMINPNLDARYPVMLSIYGAGVGGHAVLADGYGYNASTLYHHLNLGWSGVNTAWYALPIVDTGIGTFNEVDGCAYNTYTNGSGEIISGRVLDQIGRPVVGASVTANRSGGGTYAATTDTNGIYALARIPSSSSYTVTVTKANYSPTNGNFSASTSSDMAATSGNYWGANLTMNMLTTALDHLVWGAVASPRPLNTPYPVTITAQNLTNGVASGFNGTVALSAYASGVGASATIIGSTTSGSYISGSEMTLGYAFTPSTNVQVTAVRGYSTDKVSIWTDSGTLLGSQAVSASGSWVEVVMASPITLLAGTTYRVGSHLPAGMHGYYRSSGWPTTFANGTVGQNFCLSYGDVCPISVQATGQGPLVDLRYQVAFSNAIPVSPTTSGAFTSGVWNGNLSVGTLATNVVLKADDGAGHIALSNPFNVTTPIRLLSPQRLGGGQFQCTISSAVGLKIEMQASTNFQNWDALATLTNSTGTTNYTDPNTGLKRRFYRARQLP
jgi:hypothetical protein